jgi:hypothetical protein
MRLNAVLELNNLKILETNCKRMCIQAKLCGRTRIIGNEHITEQVSCTLNVKMSDQLNEDIKELLHI